MSETLLPAAPGDVLELDELWSFVGCKLNPRCIAEDTPHGRHLVFPSQYRREKDIPRDPDIFVSYTFSGEWQTVWTTLVVRLWYSQEFQHRELWRNAAEFASPQGYTLGLKIDNQQGKGTAKISF